LNTLQLCRKACQAGRKSSSIQPVRSDHSTGTCFDNVIGSCGLDDGGWGSVAGAGFADCSAISGGTVVWVEHAASMSKNRSGRKQVWNFIGYSLQYVVF